ncbi:MAG: VWA domain-containing protein [Rickettsiales bacterium]|nr:MAG: VWA domain-containing protein [Rickettsiales bacterium]
MFTFYWPLMVLLLPVPLIIWFFLPPDKNANSDSSPELLFPYVQRLLTAFERKEVAPSDSKKYFIIMLSLLWASLVIALMRPQWADQMEYDHKKGYDIMLAVDVSASMEALDFSTLTKSISRLDVTKEVVSNFAGRRKGDRLGLILFGEHAYLQVPMSFDTLAVSKMLNNAVSGMAGASTAIGDAIGIAVREIRSRPKKSRILILLTDGADTSSNIPPIEAAKIAKHYGIRVYVIGVGRSGPVPYPNQFGQISMVEIGMDEEMLAKIAAITGGQYFKATDSTALEVIYDKIDKMEKIEINMLGYKIRQPLYRYPLGFACILFLALCLMPLFKRSRYGV